MLARVRELDDQAMLRIQFSENERRADISALERARWFAEVRDRLKSTAKEIAAQFGVDPSTFSLYLRLARFPDEILERLDEPRRLAVLPARRIMEVIENEPGAVQRILDALDDYRRSVTEAGSPADPIAQIDVLVRAAEGRAGGPRGSAHPSPTADTSSIKVGASARSPEMVGSGYSVSRRQFQIPRFKLLRKGLPSHLARGKVHPQRVALAASARKRK